jgi:hypothetical protein
MASGNEIQVDPPSPVVFIQKWLLWNYFRLTAYMQKGTAPNSIFGDKENQFLFQQNGDQVFLQKILQQRLSPNVNTHTTPLPNMFHQLLLVCCFYTISFFLLDSRLDCSRDHVSTLHLH